MNSNVFKPFKGMVDCFADHMIDREVAEFRGNTFDYRASDPEAPLEVWIKHVLMGVTRAGYWQWTTKYKRRQRYKEKHPENLRGGQAFLIGADVPNLVEQEFESEIIEIQSPQNPQRVQKETEQSSQTT